MGRVSAGKRPGSVALAKWALAEGCPRKTTMASEGRRGGRARHRALGWAGAAGLVLGALAALRGVRGRRVDWRAEQMRSAIKPTSLFEFSESPIGKSRREQVPLRTYQTPDPKVLMLVVFDPSTDEAQSQLEDMQYLYEKYHPHGFEVLGFVADGLGVSFHKVTVGLQVVEIMKKWGITFPIFGKKEWNTSPDERSNRFNCALWVRRQRVLAEYKLLMNVPDIEHDETWEKREMELRWQVGVLDVENATNQELENSLQTPLWDNFFKVFFDRDGKYIWPLGDPATEWWTRPGYWRDGLKGYLTDNEDTLRQLLGLDKPGDNDVRLALGLPKKNVAPKKKGKRARKKNKKGAAPEL